MKRGQIVFALTSFLWMLCMMVSAQSISEQHAMDRVRDFLKSASAEGSLRRAMDNVQLKPVTVDVPQVYAFNIDGGGFVIASGDERALPVLGYSTNSQLNWEQMPENMRDWIRSYSEAIQSLGDVKVSTTTRRSYPSAINQLLKTQWGQNSPQNMFCPKYTGGCETYQGKYCVTGCLATAMAQLMYYHRWPETETTAIPSYEYTIENAYPDEEVKESFSLPALEPITFDWTNMINCYMKPSADGESMVPRTDVTDIQKRAVANLMRYCGQSIKMDYSPTISLAHSSNLVYALRKYFNYDQGLRLVSRFGYGIQEWEDMIYEELANNRPVYYAGTSNDGGHAFVCDGYDGKGFFHINWGWDSDSDGFFSLSVLNPEASDVAGVGSPTIGFNMYQEAVIGIQRPTEGTTPLNTMPALNCIMSYMIHDKTDEKTGEDYYQLEFNYTYVNLEYPSATFEIQLCEATDENSDLTPFSDVITQECTIESSYYSTFDVNKVNRKWADGTVRLYPQYRCVSVKGDTWHFLAPQNNYIEMTTASGEVTMRSFPLASTLKVKSVEITNGDGVVGKPNDVTVTFENGANEFSGLMSLMVVFIGDNDPDAALNAFEKTEKLPENGELLNPLTAGAFIKANSTEEVMFSFKPEYAGNYLMFVVPNTPEANDLSGYLNSLYMVWFNIKASTGINDVQLKSAANGLTYDLQGRRVSGTKQGLYLKNGKKQITVTKK